MCTDTLICTISGFFSLANLNVSAAHIELPWLTVIFEAVFVPSKTWTVDSLHTLEKSSVFLRQPILFTVHICCACVFRIRACTICACFFYDSFTVITLIRSPLTVRYKFVTFVTVCRRLFLFLLILLLSQFELVRVNSNAVACDSDSWLIVTFDGLNLRCSLTPNYQLTVTHVHWWHWCTGAHHFYNFTRSLTRYKLIWHCSDCIRSDVVTVTGTVTGGTVKVQIKIGNHWIIVTSSSIHKKFKFKLELISYLKYSNYNLL